MSEKFSINLSRAMLAASALVSIFFISSYWPFTLDDSFITFRYARNLVDGFGPVFNPGMPPAEGYTSFLWVLVTSLPHIMGLDAEKFAKVTGILCFTGTMCVMYRFVLLLMKRYTPGHERVPAAFSLLVLASYYSGASHVVSGMETSLYTLLLISFFYQLTRALEEGSHRLYAAAGILGFLAGLTRPEANLAVCVAFCAALAICARRDRIVIIRAGALFYAVPYAVYFLWRMYYYGHFFPLTFYTKVNAPFAGLDLTLSFLNYLGSRLGVLIIVGLLALGRPVLPALLASASLVVFFVFPSHIQGYNFRFLYPLVPMTAVLASMGAGVVIRTVSGSGASLRIVRGVTIALCIIVPLVFIRGYSGNVSKSITMYEGKMSAHIPLGKRLGMYRPAGQRTPVAALSDAGAVPYFSGWTIIDIFSLNDEHLVFSGPDPDYVMSFKPDVLVLISKSPDKFVSYLQKEDGVYRLATAVGMYLVKVMTYSEGSGGGMYLWVLAWPGTPVWGHLASWDGR